MKADTPMFILRIEHHVHVHDEGHGRVTSLLEQILTRIGALEAQERHLMTIVADLKAQADKVLAAVAAETDRDDSIIELVKGNTALITSLKTQLADAIAGGSNPAALQEVLDSMTAAETSALANAQKVTDAINANTSTDAGPA